MNQFIRKMAHFQALGEYQRDTSWTARFVLRPDYEPLGLEGNQLVLYEKHGVRNYVSALAFLRKWYAETDDVDTSEVYAYGTRDMCWQLSWLLETLEGRYFDAVPDGYAPDFYLGSRYGTQLYSDLFDQCIDPATIIKR